MIYINAETYAAAKELAELLDKHIREWRYMTDETDIKYIQNNHGLTVLMGKGWNKRPESMSVEIIRLKAENKINILWVV